ncbi:CubicO group peptidase (beta-lactamase class C family) [Saccharothrix saharensis]|uniref:CubicO group peptidase (Beta-lactamase class C family) n=1 Tax=Saccharothrix saharensis TaxID=571190 RepID=A0A543J7N7_9PSEU|nr:CubicO group peptidase (beta-lactamase class C family) [Saccharothrix saharensis]
MRRLLTAVLCGLLVASPTAAAEPAAPTVPLAVMSYNIHTGIGVDGRLDLARVAADITASGADVVGLQEVDVHWMARSDWRDQAADLAAAVGMHVYFAPIYDLDPAEPGAPRRQYGVAVLSRHPIVAAENHWITRLSTQTPNPTPAPAPGFPEVVLNVRGERVHVYNTHLDYRADPAVRRAQVADMLAVLAEDRGAPRVLLGDFNAPPDAPELAPLWTELLDAWALTNGSAPGPTYPASAPVKRIDYVAAGYPARVRATRVVTTGASDHLPVLAELVVARRPGSPWDGPLPDQRLRHGTARQAGLAAEHVDRLVPDLEAGVLASPQAFPGGVVLVARNGVIARHAAVGDALRYGPDGAELPPDRRIPMREDTIFDVASLSKLFTTVVAMALVERGLIDLDAPAAGYLPEFGRNGKQDVTLRQLLTHTSGLPAGLALGSYPTVEQRLAAVYAVALRSSPGTRYVYSDLSLIVVGKVLERVTGRSLPDLVAAEVTGPLGLRDTGYNPPAELRPRIAPTQYVGGTRGLIWGQVHDSTSWYLGGTAGHAGVFSTARDLAVFAQMLLNGGRYGDRRVLREDSVRAMTTNWNTAIPGADRGLGLDVNKPAFMGMLTTPHTVGHTGYTGTSLVVEPGSRSFVLLLTNRVHPTAAGPATNPYRRAVADDLARAVLER